VAEDYDENEGEDLYACDLEVECVVLGVNGRWITHKHAEQKHHGGLLGEKRNRFSFNKKTMTVFLCRVSFYPFIIISLISPRA